MNPALRTRYEQLVQEGKIPAPPPLSAPQSRPNRNTKWAKADCIHLGEPTGKTQQCDVCGQGSSQVPLFGCALFGQASKDVLLTGIECCKICKSYAPRQIQSPTATAIGVITGDNGSHWPTLQALAYACQQESVPLTVVDHGLHPEHKHGLATLGAAVIPHTEGRELLQPDRFKRHSEPWLKPRLCLLSPYRRSLWIDSDAVPIRGLRELFDLEGPWCSTDTWVTPEKSRALHEPLLKAMLGRLPDDYERYGHVNSGVFGFERGAAWLHAWDAFATKIVTTPRLLDVCRCRDQTALVAAMAAGAVSLHVLEDRSLNFPANGLAASEAKNRKQYDTGDPEAFLEALRADHPDARIVHWLGKHKLKGRS